MADRTTAWVLIFVTAAYIAYHASTVVFGLPTYGISTQTSHWLVLVAVGLWLYGDYLLGRSR